MHDAALEDPMQVVFDGAEEAQDALQHIAGIELALGRALEPIFSRLHDHREEDMIWALVKSVSCFRQMAEVQVRRMQDASLGRGIFQGPA